MKGGAYHENEKRFDYVLFRRFAFCRAFGLDEGNLETGPCRLRAFGPKNSDISGASKGRGKAIGQ